MKATLCLLVALLAGCVVEPRDLEGFPCDDDVECLSEQGYRCIDEVCVFDLSPPVQDAGPAPDDAGPDGG